MEYPRGTSVRAKFTGQWLCLTGWLAVRLSIYPICLSLSVRPYSLRDMTTNEIKNEIRLRRFASS